MSFANFTTSKGNSAGLASAIPRKTNAFQVESSSKDSIDVTLQNPDSQFYKSGHVFKSSNSKGYTDNDGHLLSEEGPAYDKLALHYPLDNLTNDQFADESGNNKHAKGYHIKPGMPGYKGCSTYFPGPFNSLSFDGSNEITNNDLITDVTTFFGKYAWTISMWVKGDTDSGSGGERIIKMGNKTGSFDWKHGSSSFERAWGVERSGTWYAAKYSTTLVADTWYYITGTFDGTNLKAYLNSVLETTTAIGGTLTNPDTELFIGSTDGSAYFNGQISDVRIYNSVITADQVSDIFNYGTILGHEVLHYKMEKTMGTNLVDSSGNGYTGTLTNGPSYAYGPYDASVSLPNEAFVFGEDDATVSVWMYAVSSDDKQIILSNNGYQQQFQFGIDKMSNETSYKKLFLKTKNTADTTTGYFLITETDFEPNRWYFLTIVRKDNNGYIYVDGIRCSTFNRSLTNMPKPVAHYLLDETTGTTTSDSSGNGYDGTNNGATVNQIGYSGSVGAYSFDGTNDYVSIPSPTTNLNQNLTLSLWIKRGDSDTDDSLITKSYQHEFDLTLFSSLVFVHGTTPVGIVNSGYIVYTGPATSTFTVDKWYHIVVTRKGSGTNWTVSFYVNGFQVAAPTATTTWQGSGRDNTPTTSTRDIYIGARHEPQTAIDNGTASPSKYFNGKISDVRIYDTAITADQVQELYHDRSTIYNFEEKTNLKLHLPLNHSLKDISGNGHNGSFIGGNPSYVENYKGDQNGALDFDGTDDYISVPHNDNLEILDTLTVSCWFSSDVSIGGQVVLVEKDPGFVGNFLHFIHTNKICAASSNFSSPTDVSIGTADDTVVFGSTTLVPNKWYHFTSTYQKISSTTKVSIYLNGILNSQATFAGVLDGDADGALIIGGRATVYLNGQISDVRIYDRALSNIEIEKLYQSTLRVDEYSSGTRINNGSIGSENSPISIGKDLMERFHYSGYLQQLKIYNCALNPTQIAELYHNYTSDKYHAPLENDNMLMNNEKLLPESKYLLAHYKFDGNANDETGTYNATATNSPEYKKYGVFDQSAKINSKIVAVGWGDNQYGQLGIGNITSPNNQIGDASNEMGDYLKYVELGSGKYPVQISVGYRHTCVILDDGSVKCWGDNNYGQLGYGDSGTGTNRGDESNEMGDNLPTVDLGTGRTAVQISCGAYHTGVILDDGSVKCWGYNGNGQLGYGNATNKNSPDASPVDLGSGRTAIQISCSLNTGVILDDGTVKCWGYNTTGQLGIGSSGYTTHRGDDSDEMGDNLPVVDLGTGRTAVNIASNWKHTCVILDDGSVKCWGRNDEGRLGYGNTSNKDSPDASPVDLGTGRTAVQIAVGNFHTCVILDDGSVKCWGRNDEGQLGYGDTDNRGDGTDHGTPTGRGLMGDNLLTVDLGIGRTAVQLACSYYHTYVMLDDGTIKCWGRNDNGQLGIGNTTQSNSPTSVINIGSNIIKCIQLSTFGDHIFIIGQYKGVGASTLTIANQQDYTISHAISNINSFSGWIKTDNISSGNLPIIYFNINNYLYVDTSNNLLYFESDSTAGTQQNLYVNGNLVSVSNTGGDLSNSANSITASFNKNNKKITIDSQLQPVAHYKLDEGAGTTALDSSGNGNNGTLTNGPVYTSNQNDIYGKALNFDGTDDYVIISNPSTDLSNGLTITAWIYPTVISSSPVAIIEKGWQNEFDIIIDQNYKLTYTARSSNVSGSNWYGFRSNDTINLNVWTFISVTRETSSSEPKLYINGINVAGTLDNGNTHAVTSSTNSIHIGRRINISTTYAFEGKISDVRIYNTALNAEQVKQIYNNTLLSTNVTLNKDQLLYISDAVDSNNNGFKNITYSQNNKASNYETEITTNEYIDDESNDKISVQLGRIEPEKWYHVVLTTTLPITTSNPFYFGKQSSNYFSGCIDDFRLYKKVLTPSEVKHLYNRQLSGNNLALHLPLSEPNNTSLDDKSIYQHTATNHGVESGDIGPVGGSVRFKPFGVMSFDGSNDKVDMSSHSTLFTLSGGFTFSTWVLFKTINTGSGGGGYYPRLFELTNSSGNYLIFAGGASGDGESDLHFNIHSSSQVTTTSNPLVEDTWMHITLTVNNSSKNVIIYKNGVSILDATIGASYIEEARDISFLCNNNAGDRPVHGDMSDVRFYNSILTAEQVKDIYFNQTILGTEVLHYKFNEKMGTTAFDSSGNGYDGTLTGGPTYYLSNPYRNYALGFDGSDDYISIGDISNFEYQKENSYSVSFWIKPVDSTHGVIVGNGRNNGSTDTAIGWAIYVSGTELNLYFVSTWSTYGINPRTSFTFDNNTWYHIVTTFTGTSSAIAITDFKFYINGASKTIAAGQSFSNPTGTISYGSNILRINGHSGSSSQLKDCDLSDVRIYDYALDAQEIYKVYKTGEVIGNEIVHYTFNQAAGDQVLDQSGNGHHGTATNGPTYQKVENPNLGSYLTVDSAERFNNSNGYLYPMYNISSKSHSFFCWMKLDDNYSSGKNDNCIFSKILNKNFVDMALSLNNGKLEFETKFNNNIDSSIIELYPTFLPNQWYHIGYSINYETSIKNEKSGILKFYINGIMHTKYVAGDKRYTTSQNNSITTHNIDNFHASKLYIGKRGDSSLSTFNDSTFRGCLSDIRFYETEITPIQARELFFNRNDGEIINTTDSNVSENKLLEKTYDGTDILIGHWKLGVGISKVVLDNSKDPTYRNNHGFLMEFDSKRVEGITGSVPVFDGTNDYVQITPSAVIGTIKSIAFWIKPAAVTQKTLIYITTSIYIEINASAKVNAYGFTSPSIYLNGKVESVTTSSNDNYGDTALVANKWYHITITSSTLVTTESTFYFGKRSSAYYGGLIDDVRFYDVVLTASQANNLYGQNSTVNVPYNPNLIGKWLLNGDFKDSSGYNNDGVLSGDAKFITGYDENLAFKSNANNSKISVANNYTTLRSISLWVYLKNLNQTILTTASDLYIKVESTGKINSNGITSPSIYINGVKNTISTTTGDYEVPLNEWAHITITKSAVITGNAIVFGDDDFKGAIQNVEFYDTQLTDAQVKDIYKYGTYNNLVLHYKFDEGSGTVAKDSSKNNYHGTIIGGATYTSDHLGVSNRAIDFDGSSEITNNDLITDVTTFFGKYAWTISMWVKGDNDSGSGGERIIKFGNKTGSFDWKHGSSSFERAWGVERSGTWYAAKYSTTLVADTWYYITGTFDGTNLKAYLNSVLETTTAIGGTLTNPDTELFIGSTDGSAYFNGQISDVRIYNYALTADQITDLYYENKSHHIDNLGYDHKYLTLAQKDTINNSINAEQVDIKRDNLEVYLKFQDTASSGADNVRDYNYSLKPGITTYNVKNGTFKTTSSNAAITDTELIPGKDGIDNKALSFNGTSHNITFSDTITFTQAIGGSISLWIKPENINRDILQLTSAIYLQLTNDFKLKLVFDNSTTDIYLYNNGTIDGYVSSGTELTSNTSLSPQIWNHIGLSFLTYNSTNLSANAIKLGLNTNSNYFDGEMDELKIYSIQLTHHDMYQLYLDRKTSPIVHLPMNESSGHTLCNIGSSKIDIRKVPSFKPTEDQIIKSLDFSDNVYFGRNICISENFLVIVDHFYPSSEVGTVYIFTYNGTNWTESQKIVSPVAVNDIKFGNNSIDIFNNTLAISADLDGAGTAAGTHGAVYIYNYDGSSWTQLQQIQASDEATSDYFGSSISIFNDTMAISSKGETVDGNAGVGKVYIFKNDGSTWNESLFIDSPDTTANINFGDNIKLYDDILFIKTNENSYNGSVYIYQKVSDTSWVKTQKLAVSSSGTGNHFGYSIEIGQKNTVFIGERGGSSVGVDDGSVYVYNYSSSNNTWTLSQTITTGTSNSFGNSISYYDSILYISAELDNNSGRLYLYKYNENTSNYEQIQQLISSDLESGDYFGYRNKLSKYGLISTSLETKSSYFFKRNDTINQTSTDIQPVFNKKCLKFVGTDAGTKDFYEIPFVVKNIKSISFWINPEAVGERILFQIDRTSAKNIKIDSSNNIATTGFTSPTIFINGIKEGGSPTTITTNEWYHICVITSTGLNSINGQTFIGYDIPTNSGTDSTKYFKGQMSDFRIYDCTLTNSEIQKIYQSSNIYKSIY